MKSLIEKKFELNMKQIVIRGLSLLMINNLLLFLFFAPEGGQEEIFQLPPGYSQIQVKADLKTPFEVGKEVTLSDWQLSRRINHALLISEKDFEGEKFYQVGVPVSLVELAMTIPEFKILPPLKTKMLAKEASYEISF